MQDYFASILRYAYHNDIPISLNKAKVLLKKARALSKERDYNIFNVTKKGMTGTDLIEAVSDDCSGGSGSCGRAAVSSKDLRDLKRLLTTIFHNDILEAVFNAEKA